GGAESDDLVESFADDLEISDSARHDPVPELEVEPARRENVAADHGASPGAAGDGDADRRHALPVEPSSTNAVGRILEIPNRVGRILRVHATAAAAPQVRLADGPGHPSLLHDRVDGAHESDQEAFLYPVLKKRENLKPPLLFSVSPFSTNIPVTRPLPR